MYAIRSYYVFFPYQFLQVSNALPPPFYGEEKYNQRNKYGAFCGAHRITSYNVCYTKLLRHQPHQLLVDKVNSRLCNFIVALHAPVQVLFHQFIDKIGSLAAIAATQRNTHNGRAPVGFDHKIAIPGYERLLREKTEQKGFILHSMGKILVRRQYRKPAIGIPCLFAKAYIV